MINRYFTFNMFSGLAMSICILASITGCGASDDLSKKLEETYTAIDSNDREIITAKITDVVNEFFPAGSEVSTALDYLQRHGYEVFMVQNNRYYSWPDGEKLFLRPTLKQKEGEVFLRQKKL